MSGRSGAVVSVALLVVAVTGPGGCGYSLRPSLPPGVSSVHVPVLENLTQEPGIEDTVTQALTQAVVTYGMRLAANARAADASLEGKIVEYSLISLAFDRGSNVTLYRLRIGLALTLRDLRKNEVIWKQDRIEERADFQVSGQVTQTLAREDDAVRRAAIDVARAIVSLAFERF